MEQACSDLHQYGDPQSAWDVIAPGTEEAEETAQTEGATNERPMDPDDIQANIESIERPKGVIEGKSEIIKLH